MLTAPYPARIGVRLADPGQTAAAGQAVLVLFDTEPARARVGLPPELAVGLAVGTVLLSSWAVRNCKPPCARSDRILTQTRAADRSF